MTRRRTHRSPANTHKQTQRAERNRRQAERSALRWDRLTAMFERRREERRARWATCFPSWLPLTWNTCAMLLAQLINSLFGPPQGPGFALAGVGGLGEPSSFGPFTFASNSRPPQDNLTFARGFFFGRGKKKKRPEKQPRKKFGAERLEQREMLAYDAINIVGAASAADDSQISSDGQVLFAEGTAGTSLTISTAALQTAASTFNIQLEAKSISFDANVNSLTLASPNSIVFDTNDGTNMGAITFADLSDTLSATTSGTTITFDAGTTASLANLVSNGGDVNIDSVGNLTLRAISTSGANLDVVSGGTITQSGFVNSGAGNVAMNSDGNLTVDRITSATVTLDSTAGAIASSGTENIRATNTLTLNAATGVNVRTDAATITGDNSTSGNVTILQGGNQGLTVTSFSNAGAGVVSITNNSTNDQVLIVSGSGITNPGGEVVLRSKGAVTVNAALAGISKLTVGADSNLDGSGTFTNSVAISTTGGVGADISVTAADADLQSGSSLNSGSARTTIRTSQANRQIGLGTGAAGKLNLSDAEIDLITAYILQIGGKDTVGGATLSGNVTIDDTISPFGTSTLAIVTGGGIVSSGTTGLIDETNVKLVASGVIDLGTNSNKISSIAAHSDVATGDAVKLKNDTTTALQVTTVDGQTGISTAGGNVLLQQDDLTISQPISAGTGEVTIVPTTLSRAIDLGGNSTSPSLHLTDGELDQVSSALLRIGGGGSLPVYTGDIRLTGGGIISQPASGAYDKLSLWTTGAITDGGTGTYLTVDELALRSGTGIGAFGGTGGDQPLDITATNLAAANTTSGVINIWNHGALTITSTAIDGLVGLDNDATGTDSFIGITASGNFTIEAAVSAAGDGVAFNTDTTGSSIAVNAPISSADKITLAANTSVTFASNGDLTSTGANKNIAVNAGNLITMADGAVVDGKGEIAFSAVGEITLGQLKTTSTSISPAAVSVTSTSGAIVDAGDTGGADIEANGTNAVTTLSAANGIGTLANPIETSVDTLTFSNSTSGDVAIVDSNSAGVSVSGSNNAAGGNIEIQSAAGNVLLTVPSSTSLTTSDGQITLTGNDMDIAGTINSGTANVILKPVDTSRVIDLGGSAGGSPLKLTDAELDNITTTGRLIVGSSSQTGDIHNSAAITAPTTYSTLELITQFEILKNGAGSIAVPNLIMTAGTIGTSSSVGLDVSVDSLTATTTGNQLITEANGLTALELNAGTGSVTLTLTEGALADSDPSVDITAAQASIELVDTNDDGDSVGSSTNPIGTSVNELTVTTDEGTIDGSQFLTEANGLTDLNLNAGTGNVDLTLTLGGIADSDVADDITASSATIVLSDTSTQNVGASGAVEANDN
ncbi:MAG: hypothetical protein KDA92_15640 [Planctomycetales bacterium]|nr:hypothetical protein [Planctomycetales bacterium]